MEFTRQLVRTPRAGDATTRAPRERFGDDGSIQVTGTIGYYSMLSGTP